MSSLQQSLTLCNKVKYHPQLKIHLHLEGHLCASHGRGWHTAMIEGVCLLQLVYQGLRSPTEFESTPVIGHLMQEYYLKLLGSYREFVEMDQPDPQPSTPAASMHQGVRQQVQDDGYLRRGSSQLKLVLHMRKAALVLQHRGYV